MTTHTPPRTRPGADVYRFRGDWSIDDDYVTDVTGLIHAWDGHEAMDIIEDRYAVLPDEVFELRELVRIVYRRPNYITKAPAGFEPWPGSDTCYYCGVSVEYGGSGYWIDANDGAYCAGTTEPHTTVAVTATKPVEDWTINELLEGK